MNEIEINRINNIITMKLLLSVCKHFILTSSMMERRQNSIEAPNKVLLNTFEPEFKGRRREQRRADYNKYKIPACLGKGIPLGQINKQGKT